jgi:hypothetical protein
VLRLGPSGFGCLYLSLSLSRSICVAGTRLTAGRLADVAPFFAKVDALEAPSVFPALKAAAITLDSR